MRTKVFTTQLGAGYYKVELSKDYEVVGSFETSDMELISDIDEMNNNGYKQDLIMFDDFEEVIEYVENSINH